MIELGIKPVVCVVASLTTRRKARRHVVRVGGALVFRRVAGIALGR